jgi:hypothetical protein
MNSFSDVVKAELITQKLSVVIFAEKLGFTMQYTYNLINKKGKKRWNEDSMQRACEVLGIEVKFISKKTDAVA